VGAVGISRRGIKARGMQAESQSQTMAHRTQPDLFCRRRKHAHMPVGMRGEDVLQRHILGTVLGKQSLQIIDITPGGQLRRVSTSADSQSK
jgi:hypothetical protein